MSNCLYFISNSPSVDDINLLRYPVLPFVIADYVNESLDFRDPKMFRKLSKPMAVQDKTREAFYTQQFNYLKNECDRQEKHQFMPVMAPFHYGTYTLTLFPCAECVLCFTSLLILLFMCLCL